MGAVNVHVQAVLGSYGCRSTYPSDEITPALSVICRRHAVIITNQSEAILHTGQPMGTLPLTKVDCRKNVQPFYIGML